MQTTPDMHGDGMILTADCVLPVSSPPIHRGAVAIQGSKIIAVGEETDLCIRFPNLPRRDLIGCILLPGLVNAHTHLELSSLKGRLASSQDFISWILALIHKKKAMTEEEVRESVRTGVEDALASGTTCVGEVTNTPFSLTEMNERGLRGLLFLEVLGRTVDDPGRWQEEWTRKIRALQSESGNRITIGLSPHSPYSLSEEMLQLLSGLLEKDSLPYTIHIAESREEMDYFYHHRGAIPTRLFPAVGWEAQTAPRTSGSPLSYLDGFGLVTNRLLAVHGVHLDSSDLDRLHEVHAGVVICPRSNQMLGVGQPPVEAMIQTGLPVGLGTDSLASNTSLSLWDEMRHLRSIFKTQEAPSSGTILQMATLGGARGLGLESLIGSIEMGKEADLIAVTWQRSDRNDPAADLIEKTGNDHIRMVMVSGKMLIDR